MEKVFVITADGNPIAVVKGTGADVIKIKRDLRVKDWNENWSDTITFPEYCNEFKGKFCLSYNVPIFEREVK